MIDTFKSIYRRGISFVGIAKVWDDLLGQSPEEDFPEWGSKKDWLLDSEKSRRRIFKVEKWFFLENANEMISVYDYESVVV